jgi:hypothetical protein
MTDHREPFQISTSCDTANPGLPLASPTAMHHVVDTQDTP